MPSHRYDPSKTDARKIVDAVFEAIGNAAAKGEELSLKGFGKFRVKDSAEREGRKPATGEGMTIRASKKLTFTIAMAVKDKLSGSAATACGASRLLGAALP